MSDKVDWSSRLLTFGAFAAATAVSVFALTQQHENNEQQQKVENKKKKLVDLGKYSPFFGEDDRTRITLEELKSDAYQAIRPFSRETKNHLRGYRKKIYRNIKINCGDLTPLNSKNFYKILTYLPLEDLSRVASTCQTMLSFTQIISQDRNYVKCVAQKGLSSKYRCNLWQIVAKSPPLTDKKRDMYWKLNDQSSPLDEEIDRDARRTLIHYNYFDTQDAAIECLRRLLKAYSIHDPEVGYTQGMNFIAAFLLIHMSEEEAYWMLYTLMISGKYRIRGMFTRGLPCLKLCVYQFQYLFDQHLPKLAQTFRSLHIVPELFATEWFLTIFTYRSIPVETSARIWDLFLVDGWKILHRVGLALLYLSQDALITLNFEEAVHHLKALPDQSILEPALLLKEAKHFKVTNALLHRLALQYCGVSTSLSPPLAKSSFRKRPVNI